MITQALNNRNLFINNSQNTFFKEKNWLVKKIRDQNNFKFHNIGRRFTAATKLCSGPKSEALNKRAYGPPQCIFINDNCTTALLSTIFFMNEVI